VIMPRGRGLWDESSDSDDDVVATRRAVATSRAASSRASASRGSARRGSIEEQAAARLYAQAAAPPQSKYRGVASPSPSSGADDDEDEYASMWSRKSPVAKPGVAPVARVSTSRSSNRSESTEQKELTRL